MWLNKVQWDRAQNLGKQNRLYLIMSFVGSITLTALINGCTHHPIIFYT